MRGVTTIERLGSYWSVAEGEIPALVADAVASVKGLSGTTSMVWECVLADGASRVPHRKWLCNHGISTDTAALSDSLNDVAMLSTTRNGHGGANARRSLR